MLKIRATFVDDAKGREELEDFIKEMSDKYTILNQSEPYKGRGKSIYNNIYLDIEKR